MRKVRLKGCFEIKRRLDNSIIASPYCKANKVMRVNERQVLVSCVKPINGDSVSASSQITLGRAGGVAIRCGLKLAPRKGTRSSFPIIRRPLNVDIV
jgi:hypothetical protein